MSETKAQKSERLKEEAAKDVNKRYKNGTLWIKDKKTKDILVKTNRIAMNRSIFSHFLNILQL